MGQGMLPGMRGMSRVTNPKQVPTAQPQADRGQVEGQRMLPEDSMLLMHSKKTVNGQPWTPEWRDATVDRLKDAAERGDHVSIASIFPHPDRIHSTNGTRVVHMLPQRYQNHGYIDSNYNEPTSHSDLAWADTPVRNVQAKHMVFSQSWVRPRDVLFNMGENPYHDHSAYAPENEDYLPEYHPASPWGGAKSDIQEEATSHPRMAQQQRGDTYVMDGHHRTVAELIDGAKTIAARAPYIRDRY